MSGALIKGRVIGAEAVVKRLGITIPDAARVRIGDTVQRLGFTLQRNVVVGLNAGSYGLHTRQGRLARSVNTRFQHTDTVFRSSTGTKSKYGRMWELTGHGAYQVQPVEAKALYWKGAAHPVKSVNIPAAAARPWLKPPLVAMAPEIQRALSAAMRGL